jgi:hypothetical protein
MATTTSPLSAARTMVRSDGLFCMALGAAFAVLSGQIASFTGLPQNIAQVLGVGSFLWGAFLFAYARQRVVKPPFLVRLAIINAIGAVLIAIAALTGLLPLAGDGRIVFLAIAGAVGFFAVWAYLVSQLGRA